DMVEDTSKGKHYYANWTCIGCKKIEDIGCPEDEGYFDDKPDSAYFNYTSMTVGSKECYKATSCASGYSTTCPDGYICDEYSYEDIICYEELTPVPTCPDYFEKSSGIYIDYNGTYAWFNGPSDNINYYSEGYIKTQNCGTKYLTRYWDKGDLDEDITFYIGSNCGSYSTEMILDCRQPKSCADSKYIATDSIRCPNYTYTTGSITCSWDEKLETGNGTNITRYERRDGVICPAKADKEGNIAYNACKRCVKCYYQEDRTTYFCPQGYSKNVTSCDNGLTFETTTGRKTINYTSTISGCYSKTKNEDITCGICLSPSSGCPEGWDDDGNASEFNYDEFETVEGEICYKLVGCASGYDTPANCKKKYQDHNVNWTNDGTCNSEGGIECCLCDRF
ncbi:MAG: hypothetical protein NC218_12575, partial [Acetobacter sp.]|nr:hypothetical protein [Acetobacter sp.]